MAQGRRSGPATAGGPAAGGVGVHPARPGPPLDLRLDAITLPNQALEPLRLKTAGEQIADRLVTAIALGEFIPGQRLPHERELAASVGVSRTTVREALHRLEALGYVEVRRGRAGGAYVQATWRPESEDIVRQTLLPSWQRFEWLFDGRQLIEPLVARVAARRRTDEDIVAIGAALEEYLTAGSDRALSNTGDEHLHSAIAAATHNPILTAVVGQLRDQISLGFRHEPYSLKIRARAVEEHAALAQAVIAGDEDRAAAVAREHFTITEDVLRGLLVRVGGIGSHSPLPQSGEER